MTITIDKSIPIPPRRGKYIQTVVEMAVGDSFLMPDNARTKGTTGHLNYWKKITGYKFVMRTVPHNGGTAVRVWRVK